MSTGRKPSLISFQRNLSKIGPERISKPFWMTCVNAGAVVQELLGYANVITTMIYNHVLNRPGLSVKSPADT
jgi:site-specific recombinase XerD